MEARTEKGARKSKASHGARAETVHEKLREQHGGLEALPVTDLLDQFLLAHLLLQMPYAAAQKAYLAFKAQFVDWNEVRISTAKEVQDVLRGAAEPLEAAIVLKDFLHRLFLEKHHVGLEFLRDKSVSEIRSFFKNSRGLNESTVLLLLRLMKEHPVQPLEAWMQPCAERLGLVHRGSTLLQKEKQLFEKVPAAIAFEFHALLAEHSRAVCGLDESVLDCPSCVLRRSCPYPARAAAGAKKKR
ncbi:MAG: hypothetical protein L0Z55_02500 [Planctomycetes bacterium]|nr:hypothetical protein [Planctomycetota bacterium]